MKANPVILLISVTILAVCLSAYGQQPQIPTLQVCNQTRVAGSAGVKIASRSDAAHSGTFTVRIELSCSPPSQSYPTGNLVISNISMNDSAVQGTITATTFEQVTSTGTNTPTVYLNGRCNVREPAIPGCRFWLMITKNREPASRGTPDVIGFLVFDGTGKRVAYGTGSVVQGSISVAPTPN